MAKSLAKLLHEAAMKTGRTRRLTLRSILVRKLRKRHWPGPDALPVDTTGAERSMRLSGQREFGFLS